MKNCHKSQVDLNANRSNLLKRVLDSKLAKLEEIYKKSSIRQDIRNNILENKKALKNNSEELINLSMKTESKSKIVKHKELNRWSEEVVRGVNHFETKKVVEKDLKIKSFNRLVILTEAIKKTMENDKLDMVTKIQAYKVLMNNIDECMNPNVIKTENKVEAIREKIGKMDSVDNFREDKQTIKNDGCRMVSHPQLKILATRNVAMEVTRNNQGLIGKIVGCYKWTKNLFTKVRLKGGMVDRVV